MSQTFISPWRMNLFGVLRVEPTTGEQTAPITRFRTQATGSLLAYLAYHQGQPLPREVVIDAIWPDATSQESGRALLNNALYALRIQLAVPPHTRKEIFVSDGFNIALNPNVFSTDVADFERALRKASRTNHSDERLAAFDEAIGFYSGDLLLGRYESWIEPQQDRLRQRYEAARAEHERLSNALPLPAESTKGRGEIAPAAPTIPYSPTKFFGREEEITRLYSLFSDSHTKESENVPRLPFDSKNFTEIFPAPLITLTGMGGIGKSRLAMETARRVSHTFEGRVWFVELAEATEAIHIWVRLRDALGLAKESEENAQEQVMAFLSTTPTLLVLDNMEQFVDGGQAVQFVNTLRARLPRLACLVTSRHLIGAYGEQVFPLGSLLTTATWTGQTPSPHGATACVEFFADRARAVRPDFVVEGENVGVILRLCQVLDGIPLAIELAAARINVLSPEQMLLQVEKRFALLQSRRRDIPDRHRSLQAAIETSYRLLSPTLQRTFRFLSVFRGGWTFEAAQIVCGLSYEETLDAISELNERSLVLPVGASDTRRFRLLDTLRDFAANSLRDEETDEKGQDEKGQAEQRHREFYVAFAASAEPHISFGARNSTAWLDALEADLENIRAASDAPESSSAAALQMVANLHRFWLQRGYVQEGRSLLLRLIASAPQAASADRAKALNVIGILTWATGALNEAQHYFEQALSMYEAEGNLRTVAGVLNNIGIISSQNRNFDTARDSYTGSLALYRNLDDSTMQSVVLTNLGGLYLYQSDFAAARDVLEEGLSLQRDAGNQPNVLQTLQSLSECGLGEGDLQVATTALCESLSIRKAISDRTRFWGALATSVRLLSKQGKLWEACVMQGAFQQMLKRAQATSPNAAEDHAVLAHLMLHVPDAAVAQSSGESMSFEQAIDFALEALQKPV